MRCLIELQRAGGGDEGSGVGDERCGKSDGGLGEPEVLREGCLCAIGTDIPSSGSYGQKFGYKTMGVDIMRVDRF